MKQTRERPIIQLPIKTSDGIYLARYSQKGLSGLEFPSNCTSKAVLPNGVAPAQIRRWHRATSAAIKRALTGRAPQILPPLDLFGGTAFQRSVWNALHRIALGRTRCYSDIARQIGKPKAARAVGGACAANPIPVLIPCHRVLAAGNKIGGFAGGLNWKRTLLARERIYLS